MYISVTRGRAVGGGGGGEEIPARAESYVRSACALSVCEPPQVATDRTLSNSVLIYSLKMALYVDVINWKRFKVFQTLIYISCK